MNSTAKGKNKTIRWKTPKMTVILFLILLLGIASAYSGTSRGLVNAAAAVIAAVLADVVVSRLLRFKAVFPDGAVITGLIVALVLSYMEPWYIAAVTSLFAIASKHVLRVQRKPFFNPAAFGLLLTSIIFSSGQDWWGSLSALPLWSLAIVGVGGYIVAYRTNKFPQVFAFLGTYFTILLILGLFHAEQVIELYQTPFVNAIFFLSFIMVTDPPTSPAKTFGQIWFGVLAAVISLLWNFYYGGIAFLLAGLLFGNLINIAIYAAGRQRKAGTSQAAV